MVSRLPIRSVEDIQVKLQQRINSNMEYISGCVIHPDNKITIAERHSGIVKSINSDGTLDFRIKVDNEHLFDIANMSDRNSVAVTSGIDDNRCISIIDLGKKKTSKIISVDSINLGITYINGKLIYYAHSEGIMMLNVDDESISQIIDVDIPDEAYIASHMNDIYFTNAAKKTVNCCDLQGRIKWEFKEENVLNCPLGITVDNDGFVFVLNNFPHGLFVISPDGKHYRQLLSAENGLDVPWAIDFQSSSNQLAIANVNNTVFLYALDKTQ